MYVNVLERQLPKHKLKPSNLKMFDCEQQNDNYPLFQKRDYFGFDMIGFFRTGLFLANIHIVPSSVSVSGFENLKTAVDFNFRNTISPTVFKNKTILSHRNCV